MRRIGLKLLGFGLLLLLAACGGSAPRSLVDAGPPALRQPGINCAPFARELSGLSLYGAADSWWRQAAGRYARGSDPEPGAVLVFRRSPRLSEGHVAVVSRVLGRRQIHVTQANWIPGEVDQDQLVVDVSPRNDWTEVRVWYRPARQMGSGVYGTYGFILPPYPAVHDELARATGPAARFAMETVGRPPPRARRLSP